METRKDRKLVKNLRFTRVQLLGKRVETFLGQICWNINSVINEYVTQFLRNVDPKRPKTCQKPSFLRGYSDSENRVEMFLGQIC